MRLPGAISDVLFDVDGVLVYPPFGFRDYLERVHGITPKTTDEFIMTWLREDDLPDRELLALVGATRDREIRCQVASVQEKRRASYLRHEMAFGTAFDRTLFSCELGFAKPDAAFYLNAQSVLDKQPEELLLVDDSLACIEAAQAAGWHTFHYMGPADRSRLASVLAELVTISHLR